MSGFSFMVLYPFQQMSFRFDGCLTRTLIGTIAFCSTAKSAKCATPLDYLRLMRVTLMCQYLGLHMICRSIQVSQKTKASLTACCGVGGG